MIIVQLRIRNSVSSGYFRVTPAVEAEAKVACGIFQIFKISGQETTLVFKWPYADENASNNGNFIAQYSIQHITKAPGTHTLH